MLSLLPPYVKVCGISSIEEARFAISAGASALGLVAATEGGTGISDDRLIAEIVTAVPPPIATFMYTSCQDAEAIADRHAICRTTVIELATLLTFSELCKLRKHIPGVKLVQVIHAFQEYALHEAHFAASVVDALLLNCQNASLPEKELDSIGRTNDWQLGRFICDQVGLPVFLAGGLDAKNVAEAIAMVQPFGLEVCSSVRVNGALNPLRLDAFMYAVNQTGR